MNMESRYNSQYLKDILIMAIAIGIISGVGAIVFHEMLDLFIKYFLEIPAGYHVPKPSGWHLPPPPKRPWVIPVITTLGGLLTGFIVFKFAPEAKGHGTDAAIAAFHKHAGKVRTRIPLIKMIASSITIGSGGSAGREGPMAQISAGFGSLFARLMKWSTYYRRLALAVGVGSGIGTIFKAPLGGALFGAEVLYHRDYEVEAIIPALIASVIGYGIFCMYSGWGHIFALPQVSFYYPPELLCYAVLGVICGLVGILYVKIFYSMERLFDKLRLLPHFKPAIGGLAVGIIGMIFPQVLEMGYGWIVGLAHNEIPVMHWNGKWIYPRTWIELVACLFVLATLKIIVTAFTISSGGSGGVFAPGLVIGAFTGAAVGNIFVNLFPELISNKEEFIASATVIGMMALFGGISKAPVATLIMVSEMTGEYEMMAPAALAIAISYILTGRISIYAEQVPSRVYSPAHIREYSIDILEALLVSDVMDREVEYILPDMTVEEAMKKILKARHRGLPVIKDGKLVGFVAFEDILQVPENMRKEVRVKEIMKRRVIKAYPDETLASALRKLVRHNIGQMPVVDPDDEDKVIGIISREDIVRAHDDALSQLKEEIS